VAAEGVRLKHPEEREKVIGDCPLCRRKEQEIQTSHYVPAALYPKNIKLQHLNEHGILQDDFEITDYFLCYLCEQRFSQRGESEVLRHIAGKIANKPNPLVAKLTPLAPQEEGDKLKSYCGSDAGLNMDMFAYFALSIIWRGTHSWPKPGGGSTRPLRLGLYAEPIRAFLAGETMDFPAEVAVTVIVCTDKESREAWVLPAQTDHVWFHDVRFLAFGVMFRVTSGRSMPHVLIRDSCHGETKRIHMGDARERTREALSLSQKPL
jgi:hypothetical protein